MYLFPPDFCHNFLIIIGLHQFDSDISLSGFLCVYSAWYLLNVYNLLVYGFYQNWKLSKYYFFKYLHLLPWFSSFYHDLKSATKQKLVTLFSYSQGSQSFSVCCPNFCKLICSKYCSFFFFFFWLYIIGDSLVLVTPMYPEVEVSL